ncbi:MAG: recombinase family protein [Anaerolineae bacterium]|nr:recombinase family protein [Anaerolineae bacterium]
MRAVLWLAVSTVAQAGDEKNSIPTQEKQARDYAIQNNWTIVDVLKVPGHSRNYVDIHECNRDMKAQGIYAFDRLFEHWNKRDFDVLVVRDGSRFARSQSIFARVVESTISAKAKIYSFSDGMIDESNFRMFISMASYAAAGEIDNLKKRRKIGIEGRLARGLPANNNLPISHRIVRDPVSGKATHVELNPDARPMIADLAGLILDGLSWRDIADYMYSVFGHVSEDGKPYQNSFYQRLIYSPQFWGHTATRYKNKNRGPWIWRKGEPPPEGIEIFYEKYPPAYSGELAEKIKAELDRRQANNKGRARPAEPKRYTGLLLCAECGHTMAFTGRGNWHAYRCNNAYDKTLASPDCSSKTHINEKRINEFIDARLREMISRQDPSTFLPEQDGPTTSEDVVKRVQSDISDLEKTIKRIILDKARQNDQNIIALYDEQIMEQTDRLRILKERLKREQEQLAHQDPERQVRAFDEIIALTVDEFWKLGNREINQLMYRLMGNKRLVIRDGEIKGVAEAPKYGGSY